MKLSIRTFTLATLATLALLSKGHAQDHVSRVNVPFAFDGGAGHFSAGIYTIGIDQDHLTVVHNSNTRFVMYITRSDSDTLKKPGHLAFRKYGDRYFLAEYCATDGTIVTIDESRSERRAARDLAANRTDTGFIRLALLNNSTPAPTH